MNVPLIDLFLLGTGIALNPAAVIAIILILTRTRNSRTGVLFLAGWVTGLLLLVILPSLIIMEGLRRLMGASAWLPAWSWFLLGGLLLAAAFLSLQDRARELDLSAEPRWAALIANGSGGRIFGVGATLSVASLRNVVLLAAAVALISNASLGLSGVLAAAGIFLLASSLGVLAPLLIYLFGGAGATARLEAGGDWMQRNLVWLKIIVLAAVGLGMLLHGIRLTA
ncbi:MAG: GAP family protein [Chloroflexota bacterium]|nr:GAP family protein [Chloroflexota bacterium]